MPAPQVSVLMPCYNHEEFVGDAIRSVLAQEGVDFELLVEDDGSSDASAQAIAAIQDPRLQFVAKPRNEGAATTVNNMIRRARGEYLALINSDDLWPRTDKLAMQLQLLQERPDVAATFGRPQFIAADGTPVRGNQTYSDAVFAAGNRSKARWLRYFWEKPNCLCHPTILVRSSAYREVGLFDNRLRQIPDLDMWVRLVKKHEIHVATEPLVAFRLLEGRNTSALNLPNVTRAMNEHMVLFERYFDGVDAAMLVEAFGDVLANPKPRDGVEAEIEKVLLYLRGSEPHGRIQRTIGLSRMYALLGQPQAAVVLRDYGIDDAWLHREMASFSPFVALQVAQPVAAPPAPVPPAPAPPPARPLPLLRYLSFLKR